MPIHITDLRASDHELIQQAAALLVAELSLPHWPTGYLTLQKALDEVQDCLQPEFIVRVACDARGLLMGWIGGRPGYEGRVWELHPIVVQRDSQRRGVGRALVADLEAQVRQRGARTLWLGTDDEDLRTTLGGVDLYTDLPNKLAAARSTSGHPLEFFRKLGFTIVGVVPDADGVGKPDILMAKRLG